MPQGNFIAAANHFSFLDSLVLGVAISRKIHYLVSRKIYKVEWLRWFMHGSETIPIRSISNRAVDLLMRNRCVGLFPEGRVSRNGKLQEFKRGVALLAHKTGRPIVPCAILGTYEALPIGAKLPKCTPIKVKIGKPIYVPKEFGHWMGDGYMQEVTNKVRSAIEEMLNAG